MKHALIMLMLITLTGCSPRTAESQKTAAAPPAPAPPAAASVPLVLVELYTSEG